MSSIHDLLDDGRRHLHSDDATTLERAHHAITAISHCARAANELGLDGADHADKTEARHRATVAGLAAAAQTAGAAWPAADSYGGTLIGTAADAIARLSPRLTEGERWAASVTLADAARYCGRIARQHPPYSQVPELVTLQTAGGWPFGGQPTPNRQPPAVVPSSIT